MSYCVVYVVGRNEQSKRKEYLKYDVKLVRLTRKPLYTKDFVLLFQIIPILQENVGCHFYKNSLIYESMLTAR